MYTVADKHRRLSSHFSDFHFSNAVVRRTNQGAQRGGLQPPMSRAKPLFFWTNAIFFGRKPAAKSEKKKQNSLCPAR